MRRLWAGILAAAALACIAVPAALVSRASFDQPVYMSANGHRYLLYVADTSAARKRGLGGRSDLSPSQGMLFVFKTSTIACMWMKDMRFSIDIIWTDSSKRIFQMEPNVSPDSYPMAYCPVTPARYVIELPAGSISRDRLNTGQSLAF